MDSLLKNASISASSSLFFGSQTPIFSQSAKQLVQSEKPKRSRTKPKDYAPLNNLRNPRQRGNSMEQKRESLVHVYKNIIESDTPQND